MRYLVALPMALVAAFLLMMLAGLMVGGGESGGQVGLYAGLAGFIVFVVLWARNSPSARVTFRRSLLTIAVESFALPLVGMVFAGIVTSKTVDGASAAGVAGSLIGGGLVATTLGCIGAALGIFALVLYVALRAEPTRPVVST